MEDQITASFIFRFFPLENKAFQTLTNQYGDSSINEYCGFYSLYQINERDEDDDPEGRSGRGKTSGLNSPWGGRGSICAHFGWTYDYLMWGIAWRNVQLMLADAPVYESEEDKKKKPSDNSFTAKFLKSRKGKKNF